MQPRMTHHTLTLTAAALLTGCVPSADPAMFSRDYGETVGLTLDVSGAADATVPGTTPSPFTSASVAAQTAAAGDPDSPEDESPDTAVAEAPGSAFTDDELVYLSLLFGGAGVPFDLNGLIPADNDGDGIPNIVDDDVDGDGIPNGEDGDVDGDGKPNSDDADIDGDGFSNDDDPDIDGDGEANDVDADDDGDGLSDRWDLNDDGDDDPDDEDDDDEDDEPSDDLEDLVARLQAGLITDADREQIAREITGRLNDPAQQATVRGLIDELELQSINPNRGRPEGDLPPAISAIDELYRQLGDAIDQARRSQPNPRGVLLNTRMQAALNDFVDRGTAMKRLGALFPTVPLNVASEQVADLRTAFSGDRLTEIATRMAEHLKPESRGSEEDEQRELEQLGRGAASLGRAFEDEDPADILNGVDRLRAIADQLDDEEERDGFYNDLLGRVDELKDTGLSLDDVLDDIESENPPPDDDDDQP